MQAVVMEGKRLTVLTFLLQPSHGQSGLCAEVVGQKMGCGIQSASHEDHSSSSKFS